MNGEYMLNSVDSSELFIHNIHTSTNFNTRDNTMSNLDLFLSFISLLDKINFFVHDEIRGSDHFPLTIELVVEKSIYAKKFFKLKSKKTDW